MLQYHYEIHSIPDPTLPFLYHREFRVKEISQWLNWHENIEILWCNEGRAMCNTATGNGILLRAM